MILVHRPVAAGAAEAVDRIVWDADKPLSTEALWIDLVEPTAHEDRLVEAHLGISIPTRQEMADIEPSEILYRENNARYMTARIICQAETEQPALVNITFILTDRALVTVRYDEPRSFSMFANRAIKPGGCGHQPEAVLDGLIETIIDRAAEVLANVGTEIDTLSRSIFEADRRGARRAAGFRGSLRALGRKGDVVSKVRESMVSVERMLLFLTASMRRPAQAPGFQGEWRTAIRDVQSLEEHASFLSNKVQFLLDATLGLIGMEQNDIIKLFSVVAVVFMPPTLIASIYGMNFRHMPELEWEFGYPMAMAMMVVAAVAPYLFFRWKQWL
jgi:magnesium transporter